MKPKVKPIRNLYFRFIECTKFDGVIEPQDLAIELHRQCYIDLIGHRTSPVIEHYRETALFNASSEDHKNDVALDLMTRMQGDRNGPK